MSDSTAWAGLPTPLEGSQFCGLLADQCSKTQLQLINLPYARCSLFSVLYFFAGCFMLGAPTRPPEDTKRTSKRRECLEC